MNWFTVHLQGPLTFFPVTSQGRIDGIFLLDGFKIAILVYSQSMIDSTDYGCTVHTASSDTIFVQIYMDALPGVPGMSKNQILFFKNESIEFLR